MRTISRVCATVTGRSMSELLSRGAQLAPRVDLLELRLDGVGNVDVAATASARVRPTILTCRPTWEGGRFQGSDEERRRILAAAVASDAEYVDLEWRSGLTDLIAARRGRGVVLSLHDFRALPDDLEAIVGDMAATGAEVLKIAVRVEGPGDLIRLLELRDRYPDLKLVLIGIGTRGWPTRILASRFGSEWTYVGTEQEAGQLDASTLLDLYRFRSVTRRTAIYGVTGAPLAHSLSPAMHNAGFASEGIDAVYVPFESDSANDVLELAEKLPIAGLSVTAPLKLRLAELVQEQDEECRRAGALNTIRRTERGWAATNTDMAGFLQPVADVDLAKMRCTVLGAGGAARAIAAALVARGCRVTICARRAEQAAEAAEPVRADTAPFPPAANTWDLLVNATPVGTWPNVDESPVPASSLQGGRIVYDLVYNPRETRLLREAAAAGCRTIDGLAMLVAQAERQFEWWTGRRPATGVFRRAAETGDAYAADHV